MKAVLVPAATPPAPTAYPTVPPDSTTAVENNAVPPMSVQGFALAKDCWRGIGKGIACALIETADPTAGGDEPVDVFAVVGKVEDRVAHARVAARARMAIAAGRIDPNDVALDRYGIGGTIAGKSIGIRGTGGGLRDVTPGGRIDAGRA